MYTWSHRLSSGVGGKSGGKPQISQVIMLGSGSHNLQSSVSMKIWFETKLIPTRWCSTFPRLWVSSTAVWKDRWHSHFRGITESAYCMWGCGSVTYLIPQRRHSAQGATFLCPQVAVACNRPMSVCGRGPSNIESNRCRCMGITAQSDLCAHSLPLMKDGFIKYCQ